MVNAQAAFFLAYAYDGAAHDHPELNKLASRVPHLMVRLGRAWIGARGSSPEQENGPNQGRAFPHSSLHLSFLRVSGWMCGHEPKSATFHAGSSQPHSDTGSDSKSISDAESIAYSHAYANAYANSNKPFHLRYARFRKRQRHGRRDHEQRQDHPIAGISIR